AALHLHEHWLVGSAIVTVNAHDSVGRHRGDDLAFGAGIDDQRAAGVGDTKARPALRRCRRTDLTGQRRMARGPRNIAGVLTEGTRLPRLTVRVGGTARLDTRLAAALLAHLRRRRARDREGGDLEVQAAAEAGADQRVHAEHPGRLVEAGKS